MAALFLGPVAAISVLASGDWLASGPRIHPARDEIGVSGDVIGDVIGFRTVPVTYGAGRVCPVARIGIPVKYLISKSEIPAIVLVHPEPGGVGIAIDTMRPTEAVMVCERRVDGTGEWAGIIYGDTRERCRLAPLPRQARAYSGPCRSGWVALDHLIGMDRIELDNLIGE